MLLSLLHELCKITSSSGIHNYLHCTNTVPFEFEQNIGELTDLATKKARIGGLAYPYSHPSYNLEHLEWFLLSVIKPNPMQLLTN